MSFIEEIIFQLINTTMQHKSIPKKSPYFLAPGVLGEEWGRENNVFEIMFK